MSADRNKWARSKPIVIVTRKFLLIKSVCFWTVFQWEELEEHGEDKV